MAKGMLEAFGGLLADRLAHRTGALKAHVTVLGCGDVLPDSLAERVDATRRVIGGLAEILDRLGEHIGGWQLAAGLLNRPEAERLLDASHRLLLRLLVNVLRLPLRY